jgi:hypothetical protein
MQSLELQFLGNFGLTPSSAEEVEEPADNAEEQEEEEEEEEREEEDDIIICLCKGHSSCSYQVPAVSVSPGTPWGCESKNTLMLFGRPCPGRTATSYFQVAIESNIRNLCLP